MLENSAYTMWARTTAVAVTLPSHVSMLTGVTPQKHHVDWNSELPFSAPVYPRVATLFELAGHAGYRTAMAAGKAKFRTLNRPGTIDHVSVPQQDNQKHNDAEVAAAVIDMIEVHRPDVLFIHFADTDGAGHRNGWGSPEQLAVISAADRHIGAVLAALDRTNLRDNTAVLVTADHGGAGKGHGHVGPDDARSLHIPWIISGPGVRHGYDLTQIGTLQVNTEDTCATACWLLGIPQPAHFDGKPIHQVVDR